MKQITETVSNKFSNMAILCAALVVIIHCRPDFAMGTVAWWCQQLLEEGLCTIAVPFFFIASGFFLAGRIGATGWYGDAVKKRVRTLLVPYFLWCVLFSVWEIFIKWVSSGQVNWASVAEPKMVMSATGLYPFRWPGLPPLWYVRSLFVLVLLSPVIYKFQNFSRGVICLFMVYLIACPGPEGDGFVHYQLRNGLLPLAGVFYFSLGMLLRRLEGSLQLPWRVSFGAGVAGVLLIIGRAWAISRGCQCGVYLGCLAIPCLLIAVRSIIPSCKWPRILTTASFPIYLVHKFVYAGLFSYGGNPTTISSCVAAIVGVLLSSWAIVVLMRFCIPRFAAVAFGGR